MEIYMNKKLIAIAIAAAVSAPAMAATSNVEVYGLMSLGVDSVSNNNATTGDATKNVGRVSDYASRIGFKGAEDLGNGLKAVWQIEQQINADGGSNSNAAGTANSGVAGNPGAFGGAGLRNTYVGLSSKDMGEVRIGKHDTPYKMATGRFDLFSDTLGDYNGLVGAANGIDTTNAGTANATTNNSSSYFDLRPANVVAYITPNFSGFSAVGAYVFGGETATSGSASTGNAYSLAAMYDAGPLYLTAAYEKHNFGSTNTGSLSYGNNGERKAWKMGAAYSIMDFTLSAMYEKTDDNLSAVGTNKYGHRTWFVSGKYQMGAVALKAQYANAGSDDQTISVANGGTNVIGNDGAKLYTLGADYAFSKRTTVYALYTKISNDSNAAYNFALNGASGVGAGDAVKGMSIGVKHSF
jgi:predicted porin